MPLAIQSMQMNAVIVSIATYMLRFDNMPAMESWKSPAMPVNQSSQVMPSTKSVTHASAMTWNW